MHNYAMKKENYLVPEAEIVEVRAENMICTSDKVRLGLTQVDEEDWEDE